MKTILICFGTLLLALPGTVSAQKTDSTITVDAASFKREEKPAEFPGGPEGWRKYLEANLRYPRKARKNNIQGLVKVQFMVGKDGVVYDVQPLNDPGGGLAEEAVRIIKDGPNWKPAEMNHKKVLYRHTQSITFKLED